MLIEFLLNIFVYIEILGYGYVGVCLCNKVYIVFIRGFYIVINCYGGFCFLININ